MPRELELKLALAPEDEAALRGAPALARAKPEERRLFAIYFDTPRHELAERGLALRLRRTNRRWAQTLKAAGTAAGGLHERPEWEFARPDASIDLSLFAATPLAALGAAGTLHERLAEAYRVESHRTAWQIEPAPGTRVEVVLDRGRVSANGRAQALCEVEVESLAGEAGAVFDVAAKLLDAVALRPSAVTKAERGERLRRRARLKPMKAPAIALDAAATPAEAARVVIGAALGQLQANEEGLLASSDPEFVHQARVALRRLRSALRIFRDVIGAERADAWRAALSETGRALGAARDWDVFGAEVLPPVIAAYGDRTLAKKLARTVAGRRRAEREAARAAVASRAHAHALLAVTRWIALPEPPPIPSEPLADFASRVVRKRHRRLVADAARFGSLTAEERHRLRIDVKRIRYGVDAMASLFPGKRVERYVDVLVALQDALGQANDAVNALRLLPALQPPESFASFARGWFGARAAGDPEVFAALVESLAATPRFWRRAKRAGVVL